MNQKLRERMEAEAHKLADVVSKLPLKDNPLWKLHTFDCHVKGAKWMHSELWPLIDQANNLLKELLNEYEPNIKYQPDKVREFIEQFEKGE